MHFDIYELSKFNAQVSGAWNKCYKRGHWSWGYNTVFMPNAIDNNYCGEKKRGSCFQTQKLYLSS